MVSVTLQESIISSSDVVEAMTMDEIVVGIVDHIDAESPSLERLVSEIKALGSRSLSGARNSVTALRLVYDVEEALAVNARRYIDTFHRSSKIYRQKIHRKLDWLNAETVEKQLGLLDTRNKNNAMKLRGVFDVTVDMKKQVINYLGLWVVIAHQLANYSHNAIVGIEQYGQHLKDRFIQPRKKETPAGMQAVIINDPEKPEKTEHVKIKLLEDNPVLTDILLDFVEALPRGRERGGSPREYSTYSLESAMERLIDLGDPSILDFIVNPRQRFADIADKVQRFFDFYKVFAEYAHRLYDLPHVDTNWIPTISDDIIDRVCDGVTIEDLRRNIAKLSKADFDAVVQREEDYTPEDEYERRTMEIRTNQLKTLYGAMKNIGAIDSESASPVFDLESKGLSVADRNRKIAETALRKVLDDNVRLENLSRTPTSRKMQRDLDEGNLYFFGEQGSGMLAGEFRWVRAPAPEAKMEDVYGASFDEAKGVIGKIILAAKYPHLMRVTHHLGKPRDHIMLIGPPGCGKTTLAEAVCGSHKIIGASVSVNDIETKWAGEKVANVGRVYAGAEAISESNGKPVIIVLDEFEAFFEKSGYDSGKVESVLLNVLQGVRDYRGVMTMAMTNEPVQVPLRIMRRFQYVGIVGELTSNERASLFKKFLETGLPVDPNMGEHYLAFAERLKDAPGDVVSKVVERIYGEVLPGFLTRYGGDAERIEAKLREMELGGKSLVESRAYARQELQQKSIIVLPDDVGKALARVIGDPAVVKEISIARRIYRDARQMMDAIAEGRTEDPFGARVIRGIR